MEGVLFIILHVILTILHSIPLPQVRPLLHYKSRATIQHTTLSLYISNLHREDKIIVALLVVVLVETKEGIRSGHLYNEFEDMDKRLQRRLR